MTCFSWQFTCFPCEWALPQSEYLRIPAWFRSTHQYLQCSEHMDRHHSFETISGGTDKGLWEASTLDSGQELGSICPASWAGDSVMHWLSLPVKLPELLSFALCFSHFNSLKGACNWRRNNDYSLCAQQDWKQAGSPSVCGIERIGLQPVKVGGHPLSNCVLG